MKNEYIKNSHVSEIKLRDILSYFCENFSATTTTQLSKKTGIQSTDCTFPLKKEL